MKKRLYRSKTDKKLCGVCAGVADYFGIDPTIVRVIWALLAFFYGTSILLYVIMALVVPEQPAGGGVIDVDSEVREPSSSSVGSSWDAKAATALRAKPSFVLRLRNSSFM